MKDKCCLFILVVYIISISSPTSGWQVSPNQYHIQTDEGPERYFRYQTDNGQYRKEKRLEDGTVVGTYAWIDDNGFLIQRDYIADNAGYRILKNKNVYVGRGVPVGEAVKATKKYAISAGPLVSQSPRRPVITDLPSQSNYLPPTLHSTTYLPPVTGSYIPPISSTTPPPTLYKPAKPYVETSYLPSNIPSTTVSPPIYSTSPTAYNVEISPNAFPSSTISPLQTSTTGYVEITQNSISASTNHYASSTPDYLFLPKNNSISYINDNYYQSTPSPISAPSNVQYVQPYPEENSLDYNPYVSQVDNNYVFQNGPTYPVDRNGQSFNGRIGNGYDKQYPNYDGVSVTNDGFRYYIPRAYQEEQTEGDKRTGSFGYVDPFGIRRVIYYNAAPGTGFQHRKNNRYVGLHATPYDPRPY